MVPTDLESAKKSTASVCLHVFCSILPLPSQSKDKKFSKTAFFLTNQLLILFENLSSQLFVY